MKENEFTSAPQLLLTKRSSKRKKKPTVVKKARKISNQAIPKVFRECVQFDSTAYRKSMKELYPEGLHHLMAEEDELERHHRLYAAHIPDPKRVKMIIISESPAKTPTEWIRPKEEYTQAPNPNYPPENHVHLVHCLSYGEKTLLAPPKEGLGRSAKLSASRGTPEFWRVLSTVAGQTAIRGGVDPLDKFETCFTDNVAHPDDEARIQSKEDTLKACKEQGIGLIDCSLMPIYLGSEKETRISKKGREYWTPKYSLTVSKKRQILRKSFELYSLQWIEALKPAKVLILGKTVGDAIGKDLIERLGEAAVRTVIHPSYNRVKGKKYVPTLKEIRDFAERSR